jgi:tRNA-splicing ligase RtcB
LTDTLTRGVPAGVERAVLFLPAERVEPEAMRQIVNTASLPFIFHHVAVMPDCHYGKGATVGTVLATRGALIPAAVGVDIGCGMTAVRTPLGRSDVPDSAALRRGIERRIPVSAGRVNRKMTESAEARVRALEAAAARDYAALDPSWRLALGTLGGGNHFIELCLDESDRVWVMLHSGSRGLGNVLGRYFIAAARKDMQRHQMNLPDKDLAYFSEGSDWFDDYVEAVEWGQDYAWLNRREMMRLILEVLKRELPAFELDGEAINCHHNYVAQEEHFGEKLFITRKGAISARVDELGIIPGSMGAKSYIVRGLGNEQSFHSCAHGAGRRMSRTQAKRQFNRHDLEQQTAGVECRKDGGVIDEIPGAYKDIDEVMANQSDLVEVVHTLKQVLCVKG